MTQEQLTTATVSQPPNKVNDGGRAPELMELDSALVLALTIMGAG